MRTKEEYINALENIGSIYISNQGCVSMVYDDDYKLLQELIDNLKENE